MQAEAEACARTALVRAGAGLGAGCRRRGRWARGGEPAAALVLTEGGQLMVHDLKTLQPVPLSLPFQELPSVTASLFMPGDCNAKVCFGLNNSACWQTPSVLACVLQNRHMGAAPAMKYSADRSSWRQCWPIMRVQRGKEDFPHAVSTAALAAAHSAAGGRAMPQPRSADPAGAGAGCWRAGRPRRPLPRALRDRRCT